MEREKPVELRFFDWKRICEERYLELKKVKPSKARTPRSFTAGDFLDQNHREGAEQKAGVLIPVTGAGGETHLTKKPGDTISFNVKIVNTDVEAVDYIVKVMYAERGLDDWELADMEICGLEPVAYKYVELGGLELSEEMAGKCYDVLFQLVDAETGVLLDEAVLEKAWYVEEAHSSGLHHLEMGSLD